MPGWTGPNRSKLGPLGPLLPKRGQHAGGQDPAPQDQTERMAEGWGWCGAAWERQGGVGAGFRAAQLEKARLPPENSPAGSASQARDLGERWV